MLLEIRRRPFEAGFLFRESGHFDVTLAYFQVNIRDGRLLLPDDPVQRLEFFIVTTECRTLLRKLLLGLRSSGLL